jgi:hypothetical protein
MRKPGPADFLECSCLAPAAVAARVILALPEKPFYAASSLTERVLVALHRHLVIDERFLLRLFHDRVAVGAGLVGLIVGDSG